MMLIGHPQHLQAPNWTLGLHQTCSTTVFPFSTDGDSILPSSVLLGPPYYLPWIPAYLHTQLISKSCQFYLQNQSKWKTPWWPPQPLHPHHPHLPCCFAVCSYKRGLYKPWSLYTERSRSFLQCWHKYLKVHSIVCGSLMADYGSLSHIYSLPFLNTSLNTPGPFN